ncbi:MAG: c-type cytochrome [Alphaproteobacteria bacterium]|nr:c-type cytochrome [Alphaproteobacteria bacterium]MBV8411230.1 c-type cytochrome [Alphaproteobacteria bacterium]
MLIRPRILASFLASVLLLAGTAAQAESLQELIETCDACHGKKGVSEVEGMPSIAAQPDIFLQYQLVFIRDGARKVEAMEDIAKKLSDEDIRALGAYYARQRPPPALRGGPKVDVAKVKQLIEPRKCNSCHKEDYSGQGETARLAGQRPEYLVKALSDFRAGVRRGRGMGAMMEVSITLHDQDMEMIAAYLAAKP